MQMIDRLSQELREALPRLHDPAFQHPAFLRHAIAPGAESPGGVRAEILRAIDSLGPPADAPRGTRAWQDYEILRNRYVLRLTQEETADRMQIGLRTVQRAQGQAIDALAAAIWSRSHSRRRIAGDSGPRALPRSTDLIGPTGQTADWRSQAREELAVLRTRAPHAVADVRKTIEEVLHLREAISQPGDIDFEMGFVQPGLVAAVHPVALRQILITAINRLARYVAHGRVAVYAGLEDGKPRITLVGVIAAADWPTEEDVAGDILLPEGASVETQRQADTIYVTIRLPSSGQITVLVVDDNPEMLHFYRRCTAGTSFRIVSPPGDKPLVASIGAMTPDIVVLDIMLPDVDGWELLMRLHENPETRAIPVVVASVVREEELALSLGAARYLPKPVHPKDLVDALNEVLLDREARLSEPGRTSPAARPPDPRQPK